MWWCFPASTYSHVFIEMGNFEETESTSGFLYLLVHFSHSWTTCSKTHCGNSPMELTLCRSMLRLPKKWCGIQISLDSYLNCKTCCMNLGCPLWFHNFLMWFFLPPQNACKDQRVCLNGVLYMEIGGKAMQTGHTTPNFWNLHWFPNVSRLTT